MGANKIREVPESIGNLTQLQALNFCDNLIEKIPSTIAKLHNLKTLSLHKNRFRTLPPELISLRNLTEISLRDNPLVERFLQRKWNFNAHMLHVITLHFQFLQF
jgi:Leucine-rich repeat (LRR) protein